MTAIIIKDQPSRERRIMQQAILRALSQRRKRTKRRRPPLDAIHNF